MDRRELLQTIGSGTAVSLLAGCGRNDTTAGTKTTSRAEKTSTDAPENEVATTVRLQDNRFQHRQNDDWHDILLKGVNLGMGKPGRFPGAAAITRDEYNRWLSQIADMNANVIRVYTVHPPAFYEALAAHNNRSDQPLYLFHGNWLPARLIEDETTAYDDKVTDHFDQSLRTVIDVVHGNAELADRPGYASGSFTADVSPYTIGYIAGIEWEPHFVARTNADHDGGPTDDQFVQASENAKAFDRWLATRLNRIATYEATTYSTIRPLSFTNWVTTDHISHPAEPLKWEDNVSVNPNAVVPTETFDPGLFATYHAYPYYPDFQNYSQEYVTYMDSDGDRNSYAGYLNDLIGATDHPVVIGEFGVPGSRGIAHEHVHGADQGHHTERQQGQFDAELFETLIEEEAAGGLVFAWQDEWFKRTWNTMRYTDPNRRPKWLNVQSPEERFGLLSFDPSAGITLSGTADEWTDTTELYESDDQPQVSLGDGYDAGRSLTGLRATADEAYLYLRVKYADLGSSVDWNRMHTLVAIDTTPDRGNTSLPNNLNTRFEPGADFVIQLGGPENSQVSVASHYDLFYYEYGEQGEFLKPVEYAADVNNGVYHPIRMALSYPLTIPTQNRTIPFQFFETGQLRYGTADPTASNYDSLTDVHVAPGLNTIELRIPWLLLNVRDPSSRLITGDVWEEDLGASERIEDIGVAVTTYKPTNGTAQQVSGQTNGTDFLPFVDNGAIPVTETTRFTWSKWQTPNYNERLKKSYDIVAKTFDQY